MRRRGFLGAILASGIAPFIVRAESLMVCRVPVRGLIVPRGNRYDTFIQRTFKFKDGLIIAQDEVMPLWMVDQIMDRMTLARETGYART